MRIRTLAVALSLSGVGTLSGCAGLTAHSVGLGDDGRLADCPSAPRCVSSQARDPQRQVPPLIIRGEPAQAWQAAAEVVAAMPRSTIVEQQPTYLRAEIVSPWRFYTDDLELLWDGVGGRIDVRSTGRVGYYDFQVNADRVAALRDVLVERGVVRPAQGSRIAPDGG